MTILIGKKSLATTLVAAVVMTATVPAAAAERCTGRWGGEVPTTVSFQQGQRLRYCYRDQCWNAHWVGDKARKLVFRVGDGGATVEMTATAQGYRAIWRFGNNSSRANLTCK